LLNELISGQRLSIESGFSPIEYLKKNLALAETYNKVWLKLFVPSLFILNGPKPIPAD